MPSLVIICGEFISNSATQRGMWRKPCASFPPFGMGDAKWVLSPLTLTSEEGRKEAHTFVRRGKNEEGEKMLPVRILQPMAKMDQAS